MNLTMALMMGPKTMLSPAMISFNNNACDNYGSDKDDGFENENGSNNKDGSNDYGS